MRRVIDRGGGGGSEESDRERARGSEESVPAFIATEPEGGVSECSITIRALRGREAVLEGVVSSGRSERTSLQGRENNLQPPLSPTPSTATSDWPQPHPVHCH